MDTALDMMTPMDAMDATVQFVQPIDLTKTTARDVWWCAKKASMGFFKGDRGSSGWVLLVDQDATTWTVEACPRSVFVSTEQLAESVETFRGYLWGYGRKPIVNGNRITFVKAVDSRDVRSH